MRRQVINCEKIFSDYVSDKGLLPRIYKELHNKTNNPNIKNSVIRPPR